MSNNENFYEKRNHGSQITERLNKDVFLEGMNFCQRRNDSIKRIVSQNTVVSPFDLSAAWRDIVATCTANEDKTYTESVSKVCYMSLSGDYPFSSATLAPGGYVYLPPYMDNKIRKLDTNTDTVSVIGQIGDIGVRKYTGAVYAPDGCIYAIPGWNNSILKIDPQDDTFETFGEDVLSNTSTIKWGGACALPDGRIFGIPFNSDKVLLIDIYTQNVSTFGSLTTASAKWDCGILSPQGNIYGIPRDGATFLKINPQTLTTETFGSEGAGQNKLSTPILYSDGKIYCLPWRRSAASILDPATDAVEHVNTSLTENQLDSSVLAPNGKIYGSPNVYINSVIVYTPQNNSFTFINAGTNLYRHGILAPNGCIYFIPNKNGTQPLLKVNPGADVCRNFKESTLLSPFLNRY